MISVIAATGGSRRLGSKSGNSDDPNCLPVRGRRPGEARLVESINRPGGNVTGITMVAGRWEPKRLELLREMVPNTSHCRTFWSIQTMLAFYKTFLLWRRSQARWDLDLRLFKPVLRVRLRRAFATLSRDKAQALMVANDAFFTIRGPQIAALAARYALPTAYPWREQARSRRSDELWSEHPRSVSAIGHLCRARF